VHMAYLSAFPSSTVATDSCNLILYKIIDCVKPQAALGRVKTAEKERKSERKGF
jgi:hypothetical protein